MWQLVHAAYGWARRDPAWGIRIAELERERREMEASIGSQLAADQADGDEDEAEAQGEEDLADVERLRQEAIDLLHGIEAALSASRPQQDLKKLVQDALKHVRA